MNTHLFIAAVSYNQPRFSRSASWDADAITILNSTQLPFLPTRIFVDRQNTLYAATGADNRALAWLEGSDHPSRNVSGASALFVAVNNDLYVHDNSHAQVIRWSINATTYQPVMFINTSCRALFVDINNTLYCSASAIHQIVAKSLDDPTNTTRVAAGNGSSALASNTLNSPNGIFVDLHFTLFVADKSNHRIQRFDAGELNGTTVAGTGALGTISLLNPLGVVLDGDGYVFIADTDNDRIIGSGPDGFRCVAGCTNTSGSAANQLLSAKSMSFDSYGNIWVADYSNTRIQKFVLSNNALSK